ncbi:DUF4332 domain-containing protein [Acidihalobacter prosperus]|uniref:DUF4332 domain-containing protein n=1 Tax=Acidihalobacter prosperus TaxID=160660 RepID=A0A1A6C2H0_9GAMM|nr:DUF4332 domain-containing protein [Acidihalobacter prosperus]OBS08745.1 hypothetical protein Thpro_022995 [Acidihalobacter prosperus]
MTVSIGKLRGMNAGLAEKLKKGGITNSDKLLDSAATPVGRKRLAADTGASERDILELANRADLARIKGVAGVFGDLLEHAGVDTVKELATRRPDNLHAKMSEVNDQQKVAGRSPTRAEVESWVAEAKRIGGRLQY